VEEDENAQNEKNQYEDLGHAILRRFLFFSRNSAREGQSMATYTASTTRTTRPIRTPAARGRNAIIWVNKGLAYPDNSPCSHFPLTTPLAGNMTVLGEDVLSLDYPIPPD
jgi:hypothetical protein